MRCVALYYVNFNGDIKDWDVSSATTTDGSECRDPRFSLTMSRATSIWTPPRPPPLALPPAQGARSVILLEAHGPS